MTPSGRQITEDEYRRIGRVLRSRARRLGVPEHEVDDLVQETFLHAQSALDQGRFDGMSSIDTWIVGIGKNRIAKHWRRRNAAKRSGTELAIDDEKGDSLLAQSALHESQPQPDAYAEDRQRLARVKERIGQLPEKQRSPLVLIVGGLDYEVRRESTRDLSQSCNLTGTPGAGSTHQGAAAATFELSGISCLFPLIKTRTSTGPSMKAHVPGSQRTRVS